MARAKSQFVWHEAAESIVYSPWMGNLSITGLPQQYVAANHLIPWWRETIWDKTLSYKGVSPRVGGGVCRHKCVQYSNGEHFALHFRTSTANIVVVFSTRSFGQKTNKGVSS